MSNIICRTHKQINCQCPDWWQAKYSQLENKAEKLVQALKWHDTPCAKRALAEYGEENE